MMNMWQLFETASLTAITGLLGLAYRDIVLRLARQERKLGAMGAALLVVVTKMNPIPDEIVKALTEVFKEGG